MTIRCILSLFVSCLMIGGKAYGSYFDKGFHSEEVAKELCPRWSRIPTEREIINKLKDSSDFTNQLVENSINLEEFFSTSYVVSISPRNLTVSGYAGNQKYNFKETLDKDAYNLNAFPDEMNQYMVIKNENEGFSKLHKVNKYFVFYRNFVEKELGQGSNKLEGKVLSKIISLKLRKAYIHKILRGSQKGLKSQEVEQFIRRKNQNTLTQAEKEFYEKWYCNFLPHYDRYKTQIADFFRSEIKPGKKEIKVEKNIFDQEGIDIWFVKDGLKGPASVPSFPKKGLNPKEAKAEVDGLMKNFFSNSSTQAQKKRQNKNKNSKKNSKKRSVRKCENPSLAPTPEVKKQGNSTSSGPQISKDDSGKTKVIVQGQQGIDFETESYSQKKRKNERERFVVINPSLTKESELSFPQTEEKVSDPVMNLAIEESTPSSFVSSEAVEGKVQIPVAVASILAEEKILSGQENLEEILSAASHTPPMNSPASVILGEEKNLPSVEVLSQQLKDLEAFKAEYEEKIKEDQEMIQLLNQTNAWVLSQNQGSLQEAQERIQQLEEANIWVLSENARLRGLVKGCVNEWQLSQATQQTFFDNLQQQKEEVNRLQEEVNALTIKLLQVQLQKNPENKEG